LLNIVLVTDGFNETAGMGDAAAIRAMLDELLELREAGATRLIVLGPGQDTLAEAGGITVAEFWRALLIEAGWQDGDRVAEADDLFIIRESLENRNN
jgi:hypothetical protein